MGLLEKAKKIREANISNNSSDEELEKKELEKWDKEAKESLSEDKQKSHS